jgi:hypothetical protein
MLAIACVGALIAGVYGTLHDQLTYAISPEYFTRMKFIQFRWANIGLPPRLFASEVGFLATWWAGLIAGWFLARVGLDELPRGPRTRRAIRAYSIILLTAIAFGIVGGVIGHAVSRGDLSGWSRWQTGLALTDLPSFVVVAWIHASGYAGSLVGLLAALLYVRRSQRSLGSIPQHKAPP